MRYIKDEVQRQTEQMLADGVIQHSTSPWNSPILVVPKKIGASGKMKCRVVVDFRKLNDVTVGDSFPIPVISDVLNSLGNSKYFSTVDCASGFWQIPVRVEDRPKTAFSTNYGHFEYKSAFRSQRSSGNLSAFNVHRVVRHARFKVLCLFR